MEETPDASESTAESTAESTTETNEAKDQYETLVLICQAYIHVLDRSYNQIPVGTRLEVAEEFKAAFTRLNLRPDELVRVWAYLQLSAQAAKSHYVEQTGSPVPSVSHLSSTEIDTGDVAAVAQSEAASRPSKEESPAGRTRRLAKEARQASEQSEHLRQVSLGLARELHKKGVETDQQLRKSEEIAARAAQVNEQVQRVADKIAGQDEEPEAE